VGEFTYERSGISVLAFQEDLLHGNKTVTYDIERLVHAFGDRAKAKAFIDRRNDTSGLTKLTIAIENEVLEALQAKMSEEDKTALRQYDEEGRGNKRNGLIQLSMKRYIDEER
jgi:hypothetical protein